VVIEEPAETLPAAHDSARAIIAAFLANLGIAVAKFVGFLFTFSSSMLAESVHSLADTANQGLLLFGRQRARRAASVTHDFGYGRERYFWSFVVGLVIFALGSLFALYEGIHKLEHPGELQSPQWAIGILAVAIVLESFSLRTAVTEANHVRAGAGWWSFIRHSKVAELPVVLLEDLGALIGLTLALGAIGIAIITDDARWDAYGTLAISALLAVIAVVIANEMRSLLIGESASEAHEAAIMDAIATAPHVERLIYLRTQHLGPDELLVAAKVAFPPALSFQEVAAAIDDVERRVRARVPSARPMYIEPDVYRPPSGDS
jgi:cation diffusion facilitator family transporter